MLEISVPDREYFNDVSNEFVILEGKTFHFEHTLVTLTKWEEKYRKPFLTEAQKDPKELYEYFRIMCKEKLTESYVTQDMAEKLLTYIQDTPTATTISNNKEGATKRILTSEVIYAYIANARLPFEVQYWNLNKLMVLLGVIGELNSPPKKMSQQEVLEQNARLNADRLAKIEKMKAERGLTR